MLLTAQVEDTCHNFEQDKQDKMGTNSPSANRHLLISQKPADVGCISLTTCTLLAIFELSVMLNLLLIKRTSHIQKQHFCTQLRLILKIPFIV
jgi:hypothetical protein